MLSSIIDLLIWVDWCNWERTLQPFSVGGASSAARGPWKHRSPRGDPARGVSSWTPTRCGGRETCSGVLSWPCLLDLNAVLCSQFFQCQLQKTTNFRTQFESGLVYKCISKQDAEAVQTRSSYVFSEPWKNSPSSFRTRGCFFFALAFPTNRWWARRSSGCSSRCRRMQSSAALTHRRAEVKDSNVSGWNPYQNGCFRIWLLRKSSTIRRFASGFWRGAKTFGNVSIFFDDRLMD